MVTPIVQMYHCSLSFYTSMSTGLNKVGKVLSEKLGGLSVYDIHIVDDFKLDKHTSHI